ncbi:MAG: EAL domain-containing protein [Thermoanaerobaculia bacterium]
MTAITRMCAAVLSRFGSSCLESLVLLAPDIMKIDKRVVIGIHQDASRVVQLRRYVRIAASLGCAVVAEGIETARELDVVRGLGIEYGQGICGGSRRSTPCHPERSEGPGRAGRQARASSPSRPGPSLDARDDSTCLAPHPPQVSYFRKSTIPYAA